MARCCSSHSSLDELVEHLTRQFDPYPSEAVERTVARAIGALHFTGLKDDSDGLLLVELLARSQIELSLGVREDAARLRPQRHVRSSA
jgi:hypothetical protein